MTKHAAPTYRNKPAQIADTLMSRIINAGLKPGDVLGTEAELVAEHEVSRPTLRESLRMLEAQGVIVRRPGPGGGVLVGRPSIESLAQALSVLLCLQGVPFATVLTAREVIEPSLAFEAARNGTGSAFDELQASIDRMKDVESQEGFVQENRIFHGIIARAGRNKVLESFWEAISLLAQGEQHAITYTARNRAHVVQAHQDVLSACRDRRPEIAAARMAAHVGELEHLMQRRFGSVPDGPTPPQMGG
jgi:GntR family transcriptional regulator, transcriptional repressor for pyruvate dehydrogenase complex